MNSTVFRWHDHANLRIACTIKQTTSTLRSTTSIPNFPASANLCCVVLKLLTAQGNDHLVVARPAI
jgi:hypothetical protein